MKIKQDDYYIQRPLDKNMSTAFPDYVIKAVEIGNSHLQVIEPEDYPYQFLLKDAWIKCTGICSKSSEISNNEFKNIYAKVVIKHNIPVISNTSEISNSIVQNIKEEPLSLSNLYKKTVAYYSFVTKKLLNK